MQSSFKEELVSRISNPPLIVLMLANIFILSGVFFFEYDLKPWDVAAGMLIVREAGGRFSDFSGNMEGVSG
ncbi:MAG: hypothetical protein HGA85_03480, partial [Nanoarchaeota archaeon]|nr:hypothetical protein [Nanoarchaeota archaeon]